MDEKINSLRRTARLAGLFYLLLALTAIYGFMYVSSQTIVAGDAAATAKKILANEFLFRTGIFSNLISHTSFVFLIIALYRLFKNVNGYAAKLMVGFILVSIPIAFLADISKITALRIFEGDFMESFQPEQLNDIAMVFLKFGSYSHQLITSYWGLWLFPLGFLVYKSGFIPRVFGILLYINGAAYVVSSLTFILFPDYQTSVSKVVFPIYFVGEIPFILWLLIKGVKTQKEVLEA